METKKILIVYFSYTGNTRRLAKLIQAQTGGDLFEIEVLKPYPKDYNTTVSQGQREVRAKYKPAIKIQIPDMERYDIVFVGSPIWWFTFAPAVSTFLSENKFAGKTIVPFLTHGGYGIGSSIPEMQALCPQAHIVKGWECEGSRIEEMKDRIAAWCKKIIA